MYVYMDVSVLAAHADDGQKITCWSCWLSPAGEGDGNKCQYF